MVLEEKSLRLAHHFAEQQPDSTSYRHLLIASVACDSGGSGAQWLVSVWLHVIKHPPCGVSCHSQWNIRLG